MKAIKNKVVRMFTQIKNKVMSMFIRSQLALSNNSGEGFVDSGVKILIAVVIGALLLGGLYTLFKVTVLPTLTKKITDLFNYVG